MKKKTVDEIYVRLTDIQRREYLKRFEKFSVNMQILFVSCLIFGGALFLGFAIGSLSVCAIIDVMFCLILFFVTLYVDYVYDHKKYRQMIFILGAKTWMEIEKVVSPFDSEQAKNSNLTTKSRKSESSEVSQINNGITEENESVTSVVTDNGQNNCEIQKEEVIESLQTDSASIAETESSVGVVKGDMQNNNISKISLDEFKDYFNFIYKANRIDSLLSFLKCKINKEKYKKLFIIISNFAQYEIDDLRLELLTMPFSNCIDTIFTPNTLKLMFNNSEPGVLFNFGHGELHNIETLQEDESFSAFGVIKTECDKFYATQSIYLSFIKSIEYYKGSFFMAYMDNVSYSYKTDHLFSHMRDYKWCRCGYCLHLENFKYSLTCKKIGEKIDTLVDALSNQDIFSDLYSFYDNDTIWVAVCFLVYLEKRTQIKNKIREILFSSNLSFNSPLEEIVECFYKIALSEKDVFFYTVCVCAFAEDKIIAIFKTEYIIRAFSAIDDLKKRRYLEKMESGNIRKKYTIEEIDVMPGIEFENLINELFIFYGFETKLTAKTGDQGIDLVAKKGNTTIAIQAKRYSKSVGNHSVMEAIGGKKHYNADRVIVVTNNYFTESAKTLAKENNVDLWDRKVLAEKIEELI